MPKIKMEPDANALFWDEEGTCIGDAQSISLENSEEINLNIPGLQDWLWEYENQCLIPCESGEKSTEELNKTFDWKDFHKRGLQFAAKVRKLLPPEFELEYSAPFEDCSRSIDEPVLIPSLLPRDFEMDKKAIDALRKMQMISAMNGNSEMTLDEINAEIDAARNTKSNKEGA